MKICVVKVAPYSVDVGSRKFCLKSGKSISCNLSGPNNGVIEFSIDGLSSLEWYEASSLDKIEAECNLKEKLVQLIEVYMLEEDSKLVPSALELKHRLLDLFEIEGT